jgi:uncharacterized protein (UPF0335 family)
MTETAMSNGYDPDVARKYMGELEKIDDDQARATGEFNAARKDVYGRAKADGIEKKLLRAAHKKRKYERKLEAIPSSMEDDDREKFEQLIAALGDTPLGQWAAQQYAASQGDLADIGLDAA